MSYSYRHTLITRKTIDATSVNPFILLHMVQDIYHYYSCYVNIRTGNYIEKKKRSISAKDENKIYIQYNLLLVVERCELYKYTGYSEKIPRRYKALNKRAIKHIHMYKNNLTYIFKACKLYSILPPNQFTTNNF